MPATTSRQSESGLVICACGWRGVPTYIGGVAQDLCPACRKGTVRPA